MPLLAWMLAAGRSDGYYRGCGAASLVSCPAMFARSPLLCGLSRERRATCPCRAPSRSRPATRSRGGVPSELCARAPAPARWALLGVSAALALDRWRRRAFMLAALLLFGNVGFPFAAIAPVYERMLDPALAPDSPDTRPLLDAGGAPRRAESRGLLAFLRPGRLRGNAPLLLLEGTFRRPLPQPILRASTRGGDRPGSRCEAFRIDRTSSVCSRSARQPAVSRSRSRATSRQSAGDENDPFSQGFSLPEPTA